MRPTGLQETIDAFFGAMLVAGKKDADIDRKGIEAGIDKKLTGPYKEFECAWEYVKNNLLSHVRYGGRIAALHAGAGRVTWTNAIVGLKAVQEECVERFTANLAKHCRGVDFESPL